MTATDAFVVGESFLSEHFFASDSTKKDSSFNALVRAERRAWNEAQKEDEETPRSRLLASRAALLADLNAATEQLTDPQPGTNTNALHEVYDQLLTTLGYEKKALTKTTSGPLTRFSAPSLADAAALEVIRALPAQDVNDLLDKDATNLTSPYTEEGATEADTETFTSVAHLLTHRFNQEDAPEFALILAGPWVLITQKERWAEGRYLAIDLRLVLDRADQRVGGEIDRMLTCIAAQSLAPDPEGQIWWSGALEESVAHTAGVSEDLRVGVKESIEIIGNEVVKRRGALGLDPLPEEEAQPLAVQSLRFLYRILFLLYAEASPELGVLPVGDPAYARGYSLDRLREMIQVPMADQESREGTHLYDSLALLFRLVDEGFDPGDDQGLKFQALRADLFKPEATSFIDEVGLSNLALQEVLQKLLLSKEKRGAQRGFISYAELGINQLGAVYESLMSYTGFFAREDLYEVAKKGDPSKGSWVATAEVAGRLNEEDFVTFEDEHGQKKPVIHPRGSFVFRLSGRERATSASYYTPEVLTEFTVSESLKELLDQDGHTTTADEVLSLKVCEPALGSGAFAIEAVRQLASEYLKRKQEELDQKIDPDDYPLEMQKAKTYIALHNVFGVDLNATALELAEVSLWLDTMGQGLEAPWFGLHLRRGNSLIGSRRAVYDITQLNKKAWQKAVPKRVPLDQPLPMNREGAEEVHHFLLPAEGWGSAVHTKNGRQLAPEAVQDLRAWRRDILRAPTAKQRRRLRVVAARVEALWSLALERLRIAEQQIRRPVQVWGQEEQEKPEEDYVTREQIEASLADPNGAYQRLKTVMDAWNAMWFWPLTDTLTMVDGEKVAPPSLDEWTKTLEGIVGVGGWKGPEKEETLLGATTWTELEDAEKAHLGFSAAENPEELEAEHPWLTVTKRIAEEQGFFHWDLFFGQVFAERGGFDLQVGNPPWVRPTFDEEQLLAEFDPWFQLKGKATQKTVKERTREAMADSQAEAFLLDGAVAIAGQASFMRSPVEFPALKGLQPDTYRCFMLETWENSNDDGIVGLIHPETHFTDNKAGPLRARTYPRLRRHWQFVNELSIFDVHHLTSYGVHIYGHPSDVSFLQASALYHPHTITRSFSHDGSGDEPGFKSRDGRWDLRPHGARVFEITKETLDTWQSALNDDNSSSLQTSMLYAANKAASEVVERIAVTPRLGETNLAFSQGWHETSARRAGRFEVDWGAADSWDDVILQGPNLFVDTPFFKQPNATMKSNLDWSEVDLEFLAPNALPVTSYKPAGDHDTYDAEYTDWGTPEQPDSARNHYRIAWRTMAANTGQRTLIPALIPPGSAHVDTVFSMGTESPQDLLSSLGVLSSLTGDFAIRVAPKKHIRASQISRLPRLTNETLIDAVIDRTLKLNCLTDAYAPIWEELTGEPWTTESPLRNARQRRQALVEIDALVALDLGITADQLATLYRTQFPVLYGYDRNRDHYDNNGRLVPKEVMNVWKKKGDDIALEERQWTHPLSEVEYTYELPFKTLDREEDMTRAYNNFQADLEAGGPIRPLDLTVAHEEASTVGDVL